jgi:hypothetical protein
MEIMDMKTNRIEEKMGEDSSMLGHMLSMPDDNTKLILHVIGPTGYRPKKSEAEKLNEYCRQVGRL